MPKNAGHDAHRAPSMARQVGFVLETRLTPNAEDPRGCGYIVLFDNMDDIIHQRQVQGLALEVAVMPTKIKDIDMAMFWLEMVLVPRMTPTCDISSYLGEPAWRQYCAPSNSISSTTVSLPG